MSQIDEIQVDLAGCLLGVFAILWLTKTAVLPVESGQEKISIEVHISAIEKIHFTGSGGKVEETYFLNSQKSSRTQKSGNFLQPMVSQLIHCVGNGLLHNTSVCSSSFDGSESHYNDDFSVQKKRILMSMRLKVDGIAKKEIVKPNVISSNLAVPTIEDSLVSNLVGVNLPKFFSITKQSKKAVFVISLVEEEIVSSPLTFSLCWDPCDGSSPPKLEITHENTYLYQLLPRWEIYIGGRHLETITTPAGYSYNWLSKEKILTSSKSNKNFSNTSKIDVNCSVRSESVEVGAFSSEIIFKDTVSNVSRCEILAI